MTQKISIITPSYNQGRYLEANIQSVLEQQGVELEHIIIDGGSTDESKEILEKYSDHLTYWVSEKDNGQTDAINKGLAKASGDIITWINSDDLLVHGALQKALEYFKSNPQLALIHGKTILFKEDGYTKETSGNYLAGLPHAYLSGMTFPQPSSFFTRKSLDIVGFPDTHLQFGMDYDLFLRMALQFEFLQVTDIFSKYLLHDASKSMTSQIKFADEWGGIFSKLLRSFDFTSEMIALMKDFNLYVEGTNCYVVTKKIDKEYLEQSFLYHLAFQLTFRYEVLDFKICKPICQFLSKNHSQFVADNGLKGICQRVMLGKTIVGTLRKFKSWK